MKETIIWLSHPLSADTPAYGGGEGVKIEPITQIASGDSANTSRFIIPNHIGTHLDTPKHFFDSGQTLMDYGPDFWIFNEPSLIDITCEEGYLITSKDLDQQITPQTDLLLLRTGFESKRSKSMYWQHNPGLAPELGFWLRDNYPNLKSVGIDAISVTSRNHREAGRETHRAFLNPNGSGQPLVLIEDMALAQVKTRLSRVIVAPIRVTPADSGPCTIFGFLTR